MSDTRSSEEPPAYELEEPSDEERASSSEDELTVLLNGSVDQKRKLLREFLTGESEASNGGEFEKEMEAELSSTLRTREDTWAPLASVAPSEPKMYDKIYFDSDSDDADAPSSSTGRRRRQRCIPTNEELFYDPEEDDRDQAWVDARRRAYSRRGGSASRSGPGPAGLPSSDAVLNCPACMTTLCLDCQRHERFRTQYRAMFVMNCTVKRAEVLRYRTPPQERRRSKRRNRRTREEVQRGGGAQQEEEQGGGGAQEEEEVYHPVQCTECSTEVGVVDQDEVFHFFNILASHC